MLTRVAGVVGWPVQHSLSPKLHGYWLCENGIDGHFVPLPVAPADFSRTVDGLRRAGFVGVNVTIPHKQAAFALAHTVDEAAQSTGAVNLLLFGSNGMLEGRNTDVAGLSDSLLEELGIGVVHGKLAVVIGA